MLVDSHCHLDRLDLAAHGGSLDAALDAARARGVGQFLCIGVSADNAQAVKALAERYADVHCSVGVHPLDLEPGSAPALDWLLGELAHPRVVAIGETGLDYHYEPEAAELQQEAFRLHLEAARITAKPVIVHTREARADTLALLREAALPQAGVLHCFTEDWEMARSALDLGFYISLSGIVTFRNADALREVARQVPADRLLVETDSPYLAPIPPSRQAEPAGIRARCRRIPRDVAWRQPGNPGGADYRQFPSAVSVGPLGRRTDKKPGFWGMNPGQDH